jgi:hypothetical protein
MARKCDATLELEDGRTLRCVLKPGPENHPQDVHTDKDGEQWGDPLIHLSTPPVIDQELV